jgi:DNA-3-methyladenine glycosylase II
MQHSINHLSQNHETFAAILKEFGPPTIPTSPQGFETLCKIIFGQQVSIESAKACHDKLITLVKDFTPENILKCSGEELKNCGLSRQKSKYIRALAQAIVDKQLNLESLPLKSPEEIRSELIKIKGIGNWTIDVYLMFSIQSPDVIPLGDIGVIISIKELWQLESKEEILALTETWKPHRTAATFFLWHYYLKKRGRNFVF